MRPLLVLLAALSIAAAQPPYRTTFDPEPSADDLPVNRGSQALWQSLKKLHTRASLIMITAHPDDEDGGMLAYESRGRGTRAALLTLNRGEGGANVMSSDFFDALGLVRTQELLEAGRHYGVDQYFTRVIDYGFSKTMAESLGKWTHDRVFYDVVRVVRLVRPLVVTSVFVGGSSDGHGNHQTAGALAQEVFRAAGDPSVFPDQIRAGLRPWNPLKSYARTPWFGRADSTLSVEVEIPQGAYDAVLGSSYLQLSRAGLGRQKSQNGGPGIPRPGAFSSAYHRFASNLPAAAKEAGFFDGVDISLAGLASLAEGGDPGFLKSALETINARVEEAMAQYSAAAPERCAPALAAGLKQTLALLEEVARSGLTEDSKYNLRHELSIKRVQFNNALAQALGLSVSATVAPDKEPNPRFAAFLGEPETFRAAIPGQAFGVNVRAVSQNSAVRLRSVSAGPEMRRAGLALAANQPADFRFALQVPADAAPTRPYFSRPDLEQPYYDIHDERRLNLPETEFPFAAWAEFEFDGAPVRIGQVVQTVRRVIGLGAVLEPLVIAPAIGVSISRRRGIVPLGAKSFPLSVTVHSNVKGPAEGTVRLELPEGWTADPAAASFATTQDGEDRAVTFRVTPDALAEKPYRITAAAEYRGRQYREGYSMPGYPGLPASYLYRPAIHHTAGVDVKIAPDLKVGYVTGSGDEVPAALESLGVRVSFLAAADLASGDLARFDAVVLGVRAYAARPELAAYNQRLLDYVKEGGLLMVQYNTPEFDHNYGPYPYTMGQNPEEVTDEASKVEILAPAHRVFETPNRITARDFEGWVEERGSKWMEKWDPRYQALLETHDQGQKPQKGGLLYTRYGKGVWIYNAWAFYRQLPEGVPGAFRLFANLLSK